MKKISLIAMCLMVVMLSAQAFAAQTSCGLTSCPYAQTCSLVQGSAAEPAPDNMLTPQEAAAGWQLLFDGKTFKGWGFTEKIPGAWIVDKGTMHFTVKGGPYAYTEPTYGNFEFKADFKMAKATNSGIFFRWANLADPVQTGFEMQVYDTAGWKIDKHVCGALYDAKAPSADAAKPAGEWNTAIIRCVNSWVTITLNGQMVVSADLNNWTTPHMNPDGTPNKYNAALKDWARVGHIGFQAHGCEVWYKNVKVREL